MMGKKVVLEDTIAKLNKLPEAELREAKDFIDFLLYKFEDRELTYAIQEQTGSGETFAFLEEEEERYSEDDLKERYN